MMHTNVSKMIAKLLQATLLMLVVASLFAGSAFADDGKAQKAEPKATIAAPATNTAGAQKADACSLSFSDVRSSDWFYTPVRTLACDGIIGGYADGTFRPYNSVTRGQVAKMIVNALGWPLLNPSSARFSDVSVGTTYFRYIETAAARGVIAGYADGSFRPGVPITRAQFSKIIVSAFGWEQCGNCQQHFADVSPSNPFFGFVEAAVAKGVVGGYADGSFRPGLMATRAQFSAVLNAALVLPVTGAPSLTSEEQATVDLINSRRAAQGLGTLAVSTSLVTAARRHSNDVGPRGLCQHNGTDGSSPWDRAADAGYTGFAAGEVIGCNYDSAPSVVDGWWASPGHHDILTNADVDEIGCGWWLSAPGGRGWQTCITGKR